MVSGDDDGDNGVGDDVHSFAYDGFRQRLWNGTELTYEGSDGGDEGASQASTPGKRGAKKRAKPGPSVAWKAGDTVGCLLEIARAAGSSGEDGAPEWRCTISYFLNGRSLGVAFSSDQNSRLREIVSAEDTSSGCLLYPAVTLERGESMALNIGQREFRFAPVLSDGCDLVSVKSVLINDGKGSEKASEAVHDVSLSNILSEVKASRLEASNASLEPIDIDADTFQWPSDLYDFGLDHLKHELARRGLKTGGTLQQRAERLFSVKGLDDEHIPAHLKAGKAKKASNSANA